VHEQTPRPFSAHEAPHRVFTIGHSTRTLEAFLALLQTHGIERLIDVRRFPGSRRHPQFAQAQLDASLRDAGIDYRWLPELGGRRAPRKDSVNTAWRNAGFRGYADYMETDAFKAGLEHLLALSAEKCSAYMCAEQAWQQCHRGLISDVLKWRGIEVIHIVGAERTQLHPYTEPARILDGKLAYSAQDAQRELGL